LGFLKNIKTFRNWYDIYRTRYGLLHDEFLCRTRAGAKILVRPWADDVRIVKSVFAKKNYVNEFVSIVPNSIVVDVGANIGAFAIFTAQRAKKVFAFEPEPENFRLLCSNIEVNGLQNVTPLRMAITKKKGKKDFYIAEEQHSGSHSFFLQQYKKKIEVKTLSIMDLIKKEALAKIDFLKLDCEGSEVEIIEGLPLKAARKIEQIALEFHRVNDYCTTDRMVRKLNILGFDVRVEKNGGYIFARQKSKRQKANVST
jgi:FkbM family methyltransferase